MIVPNHASDREVAGVNQSQCRHDWKPSGIFRILPDGRKYMPDTHCCQTCLLFGREVETEEIEKS